MRKPQLGPRLVGATPEVVRGRAPRRLRSEAEVRVRRTLRTAVAEARRGRWTDVAIAGIEGVSAGPDPQDLGVPVVLVGGKIAPLLAAVAFARIHIEDELC